MNTKEFVEELSHRCELPQSEIHDLINALVYTLAEELLQEGMQFLIPEFGTYELQMKREHIVRNPTTGLRELVPPQLSLIFNSSLSLKEHL